MSTYKNKKYTKYISVNIDSNPSILIASIKEAIVKEEAKGYNVLIYTKIYGEDWGSSSATHITLECSKEVNDLILEKWMNLRQEELMSRRLELIKKEKEYYSKEAFIKRMEYHEQKKEKSLKDIERLSKEKPNKPIDRSIYKAIENAENGMVKDTKAMQDYSLLDQSDEAILERNHYEYYVEIYKDDASHSNIRLLESLMD